MGIGKLRSRVSGLELGLGFGLGLGLGFWLGLGVWLGLGLGDACKCALFEVKLCYKLLVPFQP